MENADDYYNGNSFENYEATTYEPGPWMMIGVCLYSVMCVAVFLPLSVFVAKLCRKQKKDIKFYALKHDGTTVLAKTEDDQGIVLSISRDDTQNESYDSDDDLNSIDLEKQVDSKHVSTYFNLF
jgi:hypothetical protein